MIGDAIGRASDRVSEHVGGYTAAIAQKVAMALIAAIAVVGAGVCGAIAAFWALLPMVGPIPAILIVAGALLCVSLLAYLAMRSSSGPRQRLAEKVPPATVVHQEGQEAVEQFGAAKFLAGAFAGGVVLAGLVGGGGGRRRGSPALSVLSSLGPTMLSALVMRQVDEAEKKANDQPGSGNEAQRASAA